MLSGLIDVRGSLLAALNPLYITINGLIGTSLTHWIFTMTYIRRLRVPCVGTSEQLAAAPHVARTMTLAYSAR